MRVTVTGATGLIGTRVVAALQECPSSCESVTPSCTSPTSFPRWACSPRPRSAAPQHLGDVPDDEIVAAAAQAFA